MLTPFPACPYCGSVRFFEGPHGGWCVNVTCCECGAGFNLLVYPGMPVLLVNELSPPAAWFTEREQPDHPA